MAKPTKPTAKKTIKRIDPNKATQEFLALFNKGQYAPALQITLQLAQMLPNTAKHWQNAATCAVHLEQWDKAISYGKKAVAINPNLISALDAMAHAYEKIKDLTSSQAVGLRALQLRDTLYRKPPALDFTASLTALKPFDTNQPRRNIIAFSLFGGSSKYCETAVLNVIEQPKIYPHWQCRFYVDHTVPDYTLQRLKAHGAEVLLINEVQQQWPGPMWRFAAIDDASVDRVIFRDADSVISTREASAVEQWIQSDKLFHMMRDSGSHTELMLAGLWGVIQGALPPMQQLIADFLKKPLQSSHFADQYFLREYVWPYACQSLLQHDSMFDFLNPQPFPEGVHRFDFHVGYAEGSPYFNAAVEKPDGTTVTWRLLDISSGSEDLICTYPAIVKNKQIKSHLPARYVHRLNAGEVIVRIDK